MVKMLQNEYLLAIESSCDDTSVAIANVNYEIVCQITSSQIEHEKYGGVLPELASRLHMQNILYLIDCVISKSKLKVTDLSAIAVSINPGLIGSLIVGLSFAKSYAWSLGIPLITVNHMLGHVFANHLEHPDIHAPYLALVVSGGHSELIYFSSETEFSNIGKTLDDAAGETFDKAAKLLKLGYPGGPVIDKLAKLGNPDFALFPRALKQKDNYNFSYSGLKTAILQFVARHPAGWIEQNKSDLSASIQMAIIEPLVNKTIRYARRHGIERILVGGGVAANSLLRSVMQDKAAAIGATVYFPPIALCMDNASMIAAAAIPKYKNKQFSSLSVNAFSDKGTRFI
jgi:N6-L-threonylcarbamoyladenine synthase